jgi:hypothetical protein
MHFSANTFIYNPAYPLTKWPYRLLMLSVTSALTHSITVTRIHLRNDHIAYIWSQSLSHSLTQLQSHAFTYQMTISLTNAFSHFRTHSITVPHIHLPNDHIAYWRSQSLPHTLTQLVTRVHLQSTQMHTSLLSTQITCTPKPFIPLSTHNHSTSNPSSCSGTHFLACSTTMPSAQRFTCLSSHSVPKSHHTQTDSHSPNVLGCDKSKDIKIPLV